MSLFDKIMAENIKRSYGGNENPILKVLLEYKEDIIKAIASGATRSSVFKAMTAEGLINCKSAAFMLQLKKIVPQKKREQTTVKEVA